MISSSIIKLIIIYLFKFIIEEFKLFVKHLNQINEEQKNEIKRLKEENMSFKKKQQIKIQKK